MPDLIEPPQEHYAAKFFAWALSRDQALSKRTISWVREIIAAWFWVYVICKLFIFDIDTYLIERINPQLMWIVNYKFFILIAGLTVLLLITRSSRLLLWVLHIFFYPLILVFWTIPLLILRQKSWIVAFAVTNAVFSLFTSIKYKFILAAVFVLAFFAIFTFERSEVLLTAIAAILCVLIISYVRMAIFVFRPSTVFQIYSRTITESPQKVLLYAQDKDIRALPVQTLNEAQIELRRNSIQSLVLWNRCVLFLGRKLKQYQESKLNAVAYSFNLLLLIAVTIFSFAAVNYGLYKIDPSQFNVTATPSGFIFLYYSFHAFIFGSISEVTPIKLYSQIFSMSEQSFAIVLLFILISLFFSIRSERYKEELARIIQESEQTGRALEGLIQDTYHLTLDEALREIERMQYNFMKLILWLSRDLD
jgi:hypothetical protein